MYFSISIPNQNYTKMNTIVICEKSFAVSYTVLCELKPLWFLLVLSFEYTLCRATGNYNKQNDNSCSKSNSTAGFLANSTSRMMFQGHEPMTSKLHNVVSESVKLRLWKRSTDIDIILSFSLFSSHHKTGSNLEIHLLLRLCRIWN